MADAQGTLTVRIPGIAAPISFADWAYDNLWNTVEFGFGTNVLVGGDNQPLTAFTGSRGIAITGGTRVQTPVDTNIPRSGENGLPVGWEALIYSIQVSVTREWSTTAAAARLAEGAGAFSRPAHSGGSDPAYLTDGVMFSFLRLTYLQFVVNNKVKNEGQVSRYPAGAGMHVFGTTTDLEVANNGMPSPRDQRVLVLPIELKPNISYGAVLSPSAAYGNAVAEAWSGLAGDYGFDVTVTLEGLVKRPVV